jgi:hypothetical protein
MNGIQKSTDLDNTEAIGKTRRGKYILVIIPVRLPEEAVREFEKMSTEQER